MGLPGGVRVAALAAGILFSVSAIAKEARDAAGVLELQGSRTVQTARADGFALKLTNLNPSVGVWWLLEREKNGVSEFSNIELPVDGGSLSLSPSGRLDFTAKGSSMAGCSLFPGEGSALFAREGPPYSPHCARRVWTRRETAGKKSLQEYGTDLLRRAGGVGEAVITAYKSVFASKGSEAPSVMAQQAAQAEGGGPPKALVLSEARPVLSASGSGLSLGSKGVEAGGWTRVSGAKGTFVSMLTPGMVSEELKGSDGANSMAYLLGVDMTGKSVNYKTGVDHPGLGWSSRSKAKGEGPGPDGFSDEAPLERVGAPGPWEAPRMGLVIAGGFKRDHSAFKSGPYANKDSGSHYGFVEAGVVLSSMKKGLATVWQRRGEPPRIGAWTGDEMKRGADGLLFARQNGLLLVEGGKPTKHALQGLSNGGNWSGTAGGDELTFRTALCEVRSGGVTWWLASSFTSATARAMAVTLAAYGCSEAIMLDINSPVLGYTALARVDEKGVLRHSPLLKSMDDKNFGRAGRFVYGADSRDFLYLLDDGEPERAKASEDAPTSKTGTARGVRNGR